MTTEIDWEGQNSVPIALALREVLCHRIRDRLGLLFFVTVYWSFFFMFDAIVAFPSNRPVLRRERDSGAYRISAYYCALMTSELLLTVFWPVAFFGVCIGLCNLNIEWSAILLALTVPPIAALSSQSFGLCVGTLTPDVPTGIVVGTVLMLTSMLAGGFYAETLPFFFTWIQYISFINFSFHAHVNIEFSSGLPFECLPANTTTFTACTATNATLQYISGADVLQAQNMVLPLWANYAALGAFIVIFRFLVYLSLRFYDPNGPPKKGCC